MITVKKSPLKHDKGNALSHGMYADEAAWHKKNDKKEKVEVKTDQKEKKEEESTDYDGSQALILSAPENVDIKPVVVKKEKEKDIEIEGTILDENDLETLKFIKDPQKRKNVKQNLIKEKTQKEEESVKEQLNKYREAGKSNGDAYTGEELAKIEQRLKLNAVESRQKKEIIDENGNEYDPRLYMYDREYQPEKPIGGGSKAVKPAGTYETGRVIKIWDYYTQEDVNTPLPGDYYHPKLGFISEETFNELKGNIDTKSFIEQNNIQTPEAIEDIRTYNSVKKNIMGEDETLDVSTQLTAIAEELKRLPGMGEITIQNDFGAESITLHAPNLIGVKGPDGQLLVDENGKKIILVDRAAGEDIKLKEDELKYISDALKQRESTSILNKLGYKKEGELEDRYGGDDASVNGDLRLLQDNINHVNEKDDNFKTTYKNTYDKLLKNIEDKKLSIQEELNKTFNTYLKDTPYEIRVNDNGTLGLDGIDEEFQNSNELISYVSNVISDEDLRKVKNNSAASFGKVKSDIDEETAKANKEITNKDIVEQYLLDNNGNKNVTATTDASKLQKALRNTLSGRKSDNVLKWWKEAKVQGKEITLESLYDEVYDQNWFTRPGDEGGWNLSGDMTGEELDMKNAKEAFKLIKAIDDDFEKKKERSTKKIEHKKKLSIVDKLTEDTDKVIYSKDDNETYVRGEEGNIIGVATDEEIKKSEEQKLEVVGNYVKSGFEKVDNAQLELQKLGYTDLNLEIDENGRMKKIDQMLWHDDNSEPSEETANKAEKLLELVNGYIEDYNKTLDLAGEEYQKMHTARVARVKDDKLASLIDSREFVETSFGENWRRRFGAGVDNVTLSIPALLGNDLAKQKLQQNTNEARFQKEYTWDDSPWYQNTAMVFADQGANMLYFMGTMGGGAALGATNNLAMGIAAAGVGLQSAGQKRVQHETSQEQADIAKEHIVNLDLALSQGLVTDEYYKQTRKNLDKIIDMGDMTNTQKWTSIVTTGVIEGGLTYTFGNLGRLNTAKNLNQFFTGARSSAVKNGIMDYGKGAAIKELGRGVGLGLISENAEELSIYWLTETVDAMVFEREGDYSQIGKVIIDASIMSGVSNTTSLTYGTVMNHSMRMNMRKTFKDRFDAIGKAEDLRAETKLELTKLKQEPKTKENKKKIKELESTISGLDIKVKTLQEQNILDQQNYAVQVLGIDEDTHKKIFETQVQLNDFYIQAGVDQRTLNDPDALNEKLQEYKDELNAKEKGSGDTWLEGVTDLRKTLDDAQSNWSVKTAANALYGENHKEDGSRKRLQDKLNNKTNTKSKKGKQRAQDWANADEQNKLRIEMEFANEQNLKHARESMESDEKVKSAIEQEVLNVYQTDENGDVVFNDKGQPVVEEYLDKEAWLEKNGKKRLPKQLQEKLNAAYDYYAKNYFAVSKTSMANFDVEGKTTKQVIDEASAITGEEIVFDEVGSFDGLKQKVDELEESKKLTKKEAENLRKTLDDNKEQIEGNSNGFLLGNKFFVIDGKKAKESMKTGSTENMDLTGAVHVHETGHYLDNVTKSIKEISDKGQFIHEYLTNDKNYLSKELNDKVESRLRRMGDNQGNYLGETETIQDIINERSDENTTPERQSRIDTILDEYIREVTTVLNHSGFIGLKNEIIENGRGFFARLKNRNYEVTNAREAIWEVASFLDAVSKGELSKAYRTQARVAKARGKKTAAQERADVQMSNEIQENINKLVRNSKGEVISKEQYDAKLKVRRKGKVNIADLISDRNETLNGSIVTMKGLRIQGNNIVLVPGLLNKEDGSSPYTTKAEFIQMVKDDLTTAITNYNPEVKYKGAVEGDLSGWLALHIKLKRPGVLDKIRKQQEAALAAQEGGVAQDDIVSIEKKEGTVVFAKKINVEESIDAVVDENFDNIITKDINAYKDVKALLKAEDAVLVEILQLVANEFGVNPSKLIKDSQLTVDERLAIQKKIRQIGAREMLNMLPEGFNNQADATGVPTVLLNAVNPETGEKNLLYTKQEQRSTTQKQRIGDQIVFGKKKKQGGGKGLQVQKKNFVDNINEADFLNLFGITPVGVESKFNTENRKVDSPLRAIVMQVAMVVANQSIRKAADAKGYAGLETIKSGKSDIMFSSTIVTSDNPTLQRKYYGENGKKWRQFHKNIDYQSLDFNNEKEFKDQITLAFDSTWGKDGLVVDGKNYRDDVIKDFVKLRVRYIDKVVKPAVEKFQQPESIEVFLRAEDSPRDDGFDTISKIMGVEPITDLYRKNRAEHKRFHRTNARAYGKKYKLSPDELVATMIRNKSFLENGTMSETRGMTFGDDSSFLPSMLLMEGSSYFRSDVSPGYYPQKKTYKGYQGEHKKYFIEEFLNPIYGDTKTIIDYTLSTPKKGDKTIVTIKFKEDVPDVKVEVTRSYPQATNEQMLATTNKNGKVELNMTQEEIDGRKKDSDEAFEFYDNYTAIAAERAKALYGENSQKAKEHFAMHVASMNANMKTPLRRGAAFTYAALDAPATTLKDEFGKKNFEFEHGMPAKVVNALMTFRHWYGRDISLDDIKSAYEVGILHVTFNDNVSNLFKDRMHFNYSLGDKAIKRWFNQFTQIGPSHKLYNVFTGEVIGQQQSDNWKKIEASNKALQASSVVLSTRLINHETPSVGMSAWDFDDTLATTKSGVRATVPNPDGTPQPGRKVIFLAGGAGSGKSNVVNKLGLEKQGFKIVNSDISLEWLKKNSGLPADMNDLTKEQLSELGRLQAQSRKISKGKMMKYQGNADGVVVDGTGGSIKAMEKLVKEFKDKGYDVSMVFVETSLETALERNANRKERSLLDKIVVKNHEAVQGNKGGFKEMFGERFMEVKTDNLTQEDAMPVDLTTKMNDFVSGYKKIRLDAEEFATQGADILAQGGEFDFSEFNVVTEGAQGPMFKTAMDRAKKFGTKDTYVLTARPAESAEPIQQFLASQGLNIPLENITGLGNSTGEAKAEWILGKFSEGYNDIYFADDAIQNVEAVKNVLDQLDVKSEVVQAKIQFSKTIDGTIDKMLTSPVFAESKEIISINNVKNVGGLANDGVYSNIQFSTKHRGEYENLISKNRPDLVKEGLVTETVDAMFNYVDNLNVPVDKKRKYEKITTKWLATSNIKLNEDAFKIKDAVELAEKHKEDIFSYDNPNEIIEKYAGKAKAKPTNPNNVKEFGESQVLNEEYGLTVHEVEDTKEGMAAVRKVVDTHFGPKSNPWCIIARSEAPIVEPRQYGYELAKTKQEAEARKKQLESEGFIVSIRDRGQNIKDKKEFQYELDIKEMSEGPGIMDDAWQNWTVYDKSKKYVVFQNGKLLSFYANDQYWDRMDNPTDAPVITKKKGNVTEKVELVPIGKDKVSEFVMERRTVSKDKKTVTTEYFVTKNMGEDTVVAGDYKIENRVNGQTVKETEYRPDGTKYNESNFKNGEQVSYKSFYPNGDLLSINTYGQPFGEMSRDEIVKTKGDIIESMGTAYNVRSVWHAEVMVGGKIAEVGFEIEQDVKIDDLLKTSPDGEIRLDINKVVEADIDARFMIPGVSPTTLAGALNSGIQFSKGMSNEFNEVLERTTGVEAKKVFSEAQAKIRGKKGRYKGIIPASAQDHLGLLYNFMGKGKQGDADMAFFKKALIDPFARGIDELNAARQAASNDYKNLTKQFPKVKKKLNKKAGETAFTNDQAVRVYLWNKAGFDVPGLSKRDLEALDAYVKSDPELQAFADALGVISKKAEGYAKPGEYWLVENIISDLTSDGAIGEARADFLGEWQQNVDQIFSEENLNKIEAIYGSKFREALVDSLYRMRTGRNRPAGGGRLMNNYMNWVNNSVGAIMFFNVRSAVLQTISATNYINWSDNNPLKAAAAFANQPQFWSDFVMLFNSDYLKQRRSGNRRGVNEADLTAAIKGVGPAEQAKAVVRYLLKIGFLPTQIADSFAIASGGATFYRNRVKSLMKKGMSKAEAEAQAFLDFQEATEVSQQSARPDMISQQQANPLGRLILAFQNTPMQYARIMNKAARDLANGRGDAKTHISKIIYYGAIQSILFSSLQSAIFASLGDDEEEELDKKKQRILNQMIDSVLSGIGYGGKAISTVKNSVMEFLKQRDKGFQADHAYTILQLLSFSPPIGSKLRKIYQSIQTEKFNKDVFTRRGLTMDNPVWQAIGYTIEGFFNLPVGRLSQKMYNIDNALDENNKWWERVALIMGWNTWDLGIKDADIEGIKEEIKEEKKVKAKEKREIKKKENKIKKEKEEEKIIKENQKKSKEDGICSAISKGGKRCKNKAESAGLCTIHAKVEQGTKEVQCKKIKSNKERCKMKTTAKSGYCYYHD